MPHHQFYNESDRTPPQAPLKGTHEVPVNAPIFEGHLYLQHPEKSNRWQWRLFRFDGASFTCLSTRKIKLPPDTTVDTPNETTVIQSLSAQHINLSASFHTSHTSPLLATPKDKTQRLVSISASGSAPDLLQYHQYHPQTTPNRQQQQQEPFLASYYQLPKWTVEIANISAISVLKSAKKKSPFGSSSSKSKCFCVRTYDGNCYVMKAQKYKDLERWLFVLTKMWKFAQTVRTQVIAQQQQQSVAVMQQPSQCPQRHNMPHRPPLQSQLSWEQLQEQQRQRQEQQANTHKGNGKTMRSLVPPMTPLNDVGPANDTAAPPSQSQNRVSTLAPPQPQASTSAPALAAYDSRYRTPMLSMEKAHWIDQWRDSLAELAVYEQSSTSPPPIEPIPDDDHVSSISGFTSISHREQTSNGTTLDKATPAPRQHTVSPRRKMSKRSLRSIAASMKRTGNEATKSTSITSVNGIMPQEMPLEDRPSSSLKKKRSDEVKNWISSNNRTEEYLIAAAPDMNFFQDVKTVLDGGEPFTPDGGGTADAINSNNANYRSSVRYHSSIRGRNIQVVEEDETGPEKGQKSEADSTTTKKTMRRTSAIADSQIHGISPLQTLARADGAHALQQMRYSKHNSSPVMLGHGSTDDDNDDEENMSLAEVQRNLQRVSVGNSRHVVQQQQQLSSRIRSPSASSILDRKGPYNCSSSTGPCGVAYQAPSVFYSTPAPTSTPVLSPSSGIIPSIVAPAVPPVPMAVCGDRHYGILGQNPRRSGGSGTLYAQPALSTSELTSTHSKKMYQFFDTQSSSRTAATAADRGNFSDKKQRPQSWMVSSGMMMPAAASHNTKILPAPVDYYHTRRSIDVADTRQTNNATNGWN
ncbi:hypothetical protein BX666DRAFT_2024772 [Dichotomocladium elegans]|nr:hypothetical protein BX666DRAFT_2024772 [Dichotomocladium elegans]